MKKAVCRNLLPSADPAHIFAENAEGKKMRRYVYIMSAAVLAVLMPVSGLGAVASDSDTSSLWTLKECIDYAMENNIDLQQSHNQYLS